MASRTTVLRAVRVPTLLLVSGLTAAGLTLAPPFGREVLGPLRAIYGSGLSGSAQLVVAGLPALIGVAFVGRVLLSLLPPGPIGSHAPRDWTSTWAASHLLGSMVIACVLLLCTGDTPLVPAAWILGGALLIALVRGATLPAAMVPRHDLHLEAQERGPSLLDAGVHAVAFLPVLLVATGFQPRGVPGTGNFTSPLAAHMQALFEAASLADPSLPTWRLVAPTTLGAALLLLSRGLRIARRRAYARSAWIIVAGVAIFPLGLAAQANGAVVAAAFLGAGAASLVAWARRADQRDLALALAFFAGAVLAGDLIAGTAGLIALVLASARPKRRRVALCASATLGAVIGLLAISTSAPTSLGVRGTSGMFEFLSEMIAFAGDTSHWGLAWFAFALAAMFTPWANRPARGDDRRSELRALGFLMAGTWLAAATCGTYSPAHQLAVLYPGAILFIGLVLLPPTPPAYGLVPGQP